MTKTFEQLEKDNSVLRRTVANLRRKQRDLHKTIRTLESRLEGQTEGKNKQRYKNKKR